jgi:phage-related minor tail protein
MSNNQVEYGIRINVNGNRASADAVDQVAASLDRLGSAADRAGDAVQSTQARQTVNTAAMQAAQAASHATAQAVDQVAASTTQLGATAQRTSQAVQSAQTSQAASSAALQAAQANLTDTSRSQAVQLDNVAGRHRAVQEATRNTTGSVQQLGASTAQLNNAMRQVPAQVTDIVTSLQGGQAPLTVMLQQGGQLRDSFGSIGAAARGLGSYVLGLITPFAAATAVAAGLAFAYKVGADESSAYARSLALSGNVAGATAEQLADVAREVGQVAGSQREAAGAITALVSTGQVSIDNMKQFAATAVGAERVVGRSIAETAADFAELGKSPLAALDKINDKYHSITAATYAQVKALQDQGKAAAAAEVAQKAYADGIDAQRQKVLDSLTDWERGWLRIKNAASGAVDAVIEFAGGRDKSNFEKINTLLDERTRIEENLHRAQARGLGNNIAALQAELDLNNRQINTLRARGDAARESARAQAEAAQADEARKKWLEGGDKYLSRAAQLERDLTKARNEGKAAGIPQAEIDSRLAAIRKQYSDLNNVVLAGMDAQRGLEKQAAANSLADLESRHKQQLVSDAAFVVAKRDLQLQDLAAEEAAVRKKADLAGGKADLAERKKYLGQLAELEARRKGVIQAAQNTLNEYAFAATKAIADQAKAWENATRTERSALADEAALFGQSAEARKISAEQLKVEAELRQFMLNWQKQGHAFTAQEIADLEQAAVARKDNIAAIMGERQALAGAEQLRQENRKFAADSIADEATRSARLLQIDADLWRERIKLAGEGTEAQRQLQAQFDEWYANRQLAPVVDRWKGIINNLDGDFREGFRNMLEHGHDAWKSFSTSLASTLKASLADALYQTFIKKYVVQVMTSMAGTISGSTVQAALGGETSSAGGGNLVGAAQAASNLYKMVSGGFDKIASSVAGGYDSIASMFGPGTIGSTGASATGAALGSAASIGAGLLGGHYIGNALSGGYGIGDHGQAVVNTGTAIGAAVGSFVPVLGTAIGALIGGALGGLANRAFGHGATEIQNQGMTGWLNGTGAGGQTYATEHQDGGWFSSDRNTPVRKDFDAQTASQLGQAFLAIRASAHLAAETLGVSSDAIDNFQTTFNIALTSDKAANEKAITDFFAGISDTMVKLVMPNVAEFSRVGETTAATLQRLMGNFQATNLMAQMLGKSAVDVFGDVGLASTQARQRLVDLAGGADVLGQQAATYAQNFLTEAERLAPVSKAVTEAMAGLGLASITNREQFKAHIDQLVSSGAILTEAGAREFDSLMALAEAFAQVHPAIEATTAALRSQADIQAERAELLQQLDELTFSEAELLQKRRDALDESNRALFDQVQAATKAQADQEKAATKVLDARTAITEAYEREADAIKATQDRLATFAKSLRALHDKSLLGDLSPLTPQQKYAEARAQFEATLGAARKGDVDAQGRFQDAYTAFLNASKTANASGAAYQRDFAYAQAATEEAIGWAEKQVDVGEASLAALQQQVSGLLEVKSAVQTVTEAINNLGVALGASGAGVVNTAQTASLQSLYQNMLGRQADEAGLQYWQQNMANGMSITEIASWFSRSDEYQRVHGSHANGLARVPFDGYIAELHEDEAVLTAREAIDYRAMGTLPMASLVSEIKSLRAERQGLVDELRGFRGDAERQTGDLAEATLVAADQSAEKIARAVESVKAGQVRETRVIPV